MSSHCLLFNFFLLLFLRRFSHNSFKYIEYVESQYGSERNLIAFVASSHSPFLQIRRVNMSIICYNYFTLLLISLDSSLLLLFLTISSNVLFNIERTFSSFFQIQRICGESICIRKNFQLQRVNMSSTFSLLLFGLTIPSHVL